ncbi:hypothetical protein [Nocardia sp. NPDC059239]|uniref:hypothetical protein n=1 Tax=unclassified Nocardia TaxID=2637762 RepID=UPI0036A4B851
MALSKLARIATAGAVTVALLGIGTGMASADPGPAQPGGAAPAQQCPPPPGDQHGPPPQDGQGQPPQGGQPIGQPPQCPSAN